VESLRRLWGALKRELWVALKTFGVAWLLFTVALDLLTVVTQTHGTRDVVSMLTIGMVICAVYMFWPALAVAGARVVYRILGVGAYVGGALVLVGAVTSLWLFRQLFLDLFVEIFQKMELSGPCGGHAAAAALLCLVAALLGSPGSWWALIKLFLAISGAILLGAMPGFGLLFVLIVRKVAKLASAAVSR
jgi:hypothetical protein